MMARLLGVSLRTVSNIESGSASSSSTSRSVTEIRRLLIALASIMRTDYVATWLDEANDALEGLKPIEVIERGEIDRLWSLVYLVGSGEPI